MSAAAENVTRGRRRGGRVEPEAVGVIVRPCLIGDNHAPRWRLVYCRRLLARLVRLDLARAFATPRRRSARAARA